MSLFILSLLLLHISLLPPFLYRLYLSIQLEWPFCPSLDRHGWFALLSLDRPSLIIRKCSNWFVFQLADMLVPQKLSVVSSTPSSRDFNTSPWCLTWMMYLPSVVLPPWICPYLMWWTSPIMPIVQLKWSALGSCIREARVVCKYTDWVTSPS